MDLMTRIAARWRTAKSECYVCRARITEGMEFCSDECWFSTQI